MSKLEQMTAQAQIGLAYDSLQASYDEEYKDYLFAQQATAHAQIAQAISLNEINQREIEHEKKQNAPAPGEIFEITGDKLTDDMLFWNDQNGTWVDAKTSGMRVASFRYLVRYKVDA